MKENKVLIDKLTNFRPVTNNSYLEIKPYYDAWFINRKYSRFYQSILTLSKFVNVPIYYFGIIDDCLCIIKKKYISSPVLYLIIPPIHIKGDINKELEIISFFSNHGVKTYLSDEDLEIYNIKESACKKISSNFEFIYDSKLFIEDIFKIKDSSYGNIRYYINNFKKNVDKVILDCRTNINGDLNFLLKLNNLYKDWVFHKGLKADNYQNELDKFKDMNKYISSISYDNTKIEAFGITEQISEGQVIITNRFTSRNNSLLKSLSISLHYLECKYWDNIKSNTLMNIGIGGTEKQLTTHKNSLKPVKLLQIYQNKLLTEPINKATWDKCLKTNKLDIMSYI